MQKGFANTLKILSEPRTATLDGLRQSQYKIIKTTEEAVCDGIYERHFPGWPPSRLVRPSKLLLFVLSLMCYQCFYVTTFILMEIYLFEY